MAGEAYLSIITAQYTQVLVLYSPQIIVWYMTIGNNKVQVEEQGIKRLRLLYLLIGHIPPGQDKDLEH